jgi:hypothetical protein
MTYSPLPVPVPVVCVCVCMCVYVNVCVCVCVCVCVWVYNDVSQTHYTRMHEDYALFRHTHTHTLTHSCTKVYPGLTCALLRLLAPNGHPESLYTHEIRARSLCRLVEQLLSHFELFKQDFVEDFPAVVVQASAKGHVQALVQRVAGAVGAVQSSAVEQRATKRA